MRITADNSVCNHCALCAGVCKPNAITVQEHGWSSDEALCTACRNCIRICPVRALSADEE